MKVRAVFDFQSSNPNELTVYMNEVLTIIDQQVGDGWWSAVNSKGDSGLVPSSYVEPFDLPEPDVPPPPPPANFPQPAFDDDWDSDECSQPQTHDVQADSTVSIGGAPVTDSAKINAIRKGFGRYSNKSAAIDYLTQSKIPENIHPITYIDYKGGQFRWRPSTEVITCDIGPYSKCSKLRGMKSFVSYRLTSSLLSSHVERRFKQFDWLNDRIIAKVPVVCCPALPEKPVTGIYEEEFLNERRALLKQWLTYLCDHPVASQLAVVRVFLSCVDEKRWKAGKRAAEADSLQSIRFLYTVQSNEGPVPEDSTMESVDQMEKFMAELLQCIRVFLNRLNDFHQRLSSNTGKDFFSLSEAFYSLARTLDTEVHSKVIIQSLISVFSNVGESFKDISLRHAVRAESLASLISTLQFYSKLLGNMVPVITVARCACATADETKRLESAGKLSRADAATIQTGCRVITRAVQAECNYVVDKMRQEVVRLMGTYFNDQAAFYRQIADQLDGVALLFNR